MLFRSEDGGKADLHVRKAAKKEKEKKTQRQPVHNIGTDTLGVEAQPVCLQQDQIKQPSAAGLSPAGAQPHPDEEHAAEEGTTAAAAAAAATAAVEYPHPDIPALLERLADPAYEAPRSWGAAETAHMMKLVEDPHYRRWVS